MRVNSPVPLWSMPDCSDINTTPLLTESSLFLRLTTCPSSSLLDDSTSSSSLESWIRRLTGARCCWAAVVVTAVAFSAGTTAGVASVEVVEAASVGGVAEGGVLGGGVEGVVVAAGVAAISVASVDAGVVGFFGT